MNAWETGCLEIYAMLPVVRIQLFFSLSLPIIPKKNYYMDSLSSSKFSFSSLVSLFILFFLVFLFVFIFVWGVSLFLLYSSLVQQHRNSIGANEIAIQCETYDFFLLYISWYYSSVFLDCLFFYFSLSFSFNLQILMRFSIAKLTHEHCTLSKFGNFSSHFVFSIDFPLNFAR